jgi:hypothetical protein
VKKPERDTIRQISRQFNRARLITRGLAIGLPSIFIFLKLNKSQLIGLLQIASPEFFIHVALIIYFFCWVFGANFDYAMQQSVYVSDPNEGKIPKTYFLFVPVFIIVATLLLWASQDPAHLSLALCVFLAIDIIGWHNNRRWTGPIIRSSRKNYEQDDDYFGCERLKIVQEFLFGHWILIRYGAMAVVLGITVAICFVGAIQGLISTGLNRTIPSIGTDFANKTLPAMLILVYVLLSEIWMWTFRIKARVAIYVIDSLSLKYRATPNN